MVVACSMWTYFLFSMFMNYGLWSTGVLSVDLTFEIMSCTELLRFVEMCTKLWFVNLPSNIPDYFCVCLVRLEHPIYSSCDIIIDCCGFIEYIVVVSYCY